MLHRNFQKDHRNSRRFPEIPVDFQDIAGVVDTLSRSLTVTP